MRDFLRVMLMITVLFLGFWIGISWKNSDATFSNENIDSTGVYNQEKLINQQEKRTDLKQGELETIRLFENATTSVTFITTINRRVDYWTRNIYEIPSGTGSGFIWDKEGHIVTNYHVIKDGDLAQVTLSDRSTWDATVVGVAPEKDLAVLKIEAPKELMKPLPVGASNNLLVGQSVYAIGNPFGLDQTLTTGIISALGREIKSVAGIPIKDVIQTDAAINPGNSGGPLLDSSGKLIGVNTAIYSPSGAYAGIGFSIPVDVLVWVIPELIQYGKIKRPSLGVEFATTQQTARLGIEGALILSVAENGAAEKAGIRPTFRNRYGRIELGDIIIGIDDHTVSTPSDMVLILEKYQPGQKVNVKIKRGDETLQLSLTLDQPR
ncbi:MAG: trypsin-like peptidase domain-containing protein [Saprospiraceae bacterium]|nr:trypsin-like peptidase domain-containing protein [Saprospiraceae bacterium]